MTDDAVMHRDEECRMLRQRCADLEQQLAEQRADAEAMREALGVVFSAGEENARIQLGLPVQPRTSPRRRGHLRSLSATIILFAMLAAGALQTAVHRGLRGHPVRRLAAVAVTLGAGGGSSRAWPGQELPAHPL